MEMLFINSVLAEARPASGKLFTITNITPDYAAIGGIGAQALSGGVAGIGIAGYGGPSNGASTSTYGGFGVFAVGGTGTSSADIGGNGVNAVGGNASNYSGGTGVQATGGSGYFGGDGVDAYGGSGTSIGGVGLYASADGLSYAGQFHGDIDVLGTLYKSGGSFKIDHPLDPANKYLYHSFVESPDMMNIYNGNVTTDGGGAAVVTMAAWFEALNKEFRYQLTVIGQFAQAIVASEIANGSFTIKTDKPNVKVSWQVTGVRQDAWANTHRIQVEVDKAQKDQGRHLHPELFGHGGEPDIAETHHPRPSPPQR